MRVGEKRGPLVECDMCELPVVAVGEDHIIVVRWVDWMSWGVSKREYLSCRCVSIAIRRVFSDRCIKSIACSLTLAPSPRQVNQIVGREPTLRGKLPGKTLRVPD